MSRTDQPQTLKLAIAQLNPCVGDFAQNLEKIQQAIQQAKDEKADVILFPEMIVTGYPPEDLLFRPAFLAQVQQTLTQIQVATENITVVVGAPVERQGKLYNMALVYQHGAMLAEYAKHYLPNYRVFDEKRYFHAGNDTVVVDINGVRTAILICEDIWKNEPIQQAQQHGAALALVLNASPFRQDKAKERLALLQRQASRTNMAIAYANLVGGQDELVFDGHSLVVNKNAELCFQAEPFVEKTYVTTLLFDQRNRSNKSSKNSKNSKSDVSEMLPLTLPSAETQVYQALVTGVRDYVAKNGFTKGVMLGLSGGIDSALTLAIAVDALGADNVEAVMMPFHYTADISISDARQQAKTLGVRYREIPIEGIFNSFMKALSNEFEGLERDVTEENLQARSRGVLLMAMSNKLGKMLLATGNKSEMSMGYATLYGDMAGGFAPLKDVYKTLVYSLSRYRNACGDGEIIPERVITRPPSAELAPDQKDEDSLPPYDVLDAILRLFIEEFQSVDDIVAQGFELETVKRTANLLLLNEYKRRQSAPGVRITQRAFGKDRRYPITSAYRHYL
jgi:NAD+ synthase (glutamine-hydrolysing)